eukprot:5001707-Prymnesium_polylepis.2
MVGHPAFSRLPATKKQRYLRHPEDGLPLLLTTEANWLGSGGARFVRYAARWRQYQKSWSIMLALPGEEGVTLLREVAPRHPCLSSTNSVPASTAIGLMTIGIRCACYFKRALQ